jgi:hypothetical protein
LIANQLSLTYDIHDMPVDRLMKICPRNSAQGGAEFREGHSLLNRLMTYSPFEKSWRSAAKQSCKPLNSLALPRGYDERFQKRR